MPRAPQVAGVKVGRQLAADQVAKMFDPVDVGNGGGDEVSGHGGTYVQGLALL